MEDRLTASGPFNPSENTQSYPSSDGKGFDVATIASAGIPSSGISSSLL